MEFTAANRNNQLEEQDECNTNEGSICDPLKSVKVFLKNELTLNILKCISHGAYGDVLAAKLPNGDEELAVKIVTNDHVCKKAITDWPKLKHVNILALLRVLHIPQLEVHIFITQNHSYSLETVLRDDNIFTGTKLFNYIQKWLREILAGLRYLHQKHFCHMGINVKSVLISKDFSAMICSFQSLNTSRDISSSLAIKYDVPYEYRPPEAWRSLEVAINGTAFDLWSFGILALTVFTRNSIQKVFSREPTGWWSGVYMGIYKTLEKKELQEYCRISFPGCKVDMKSVTCMRNFVTSCLILRPEDRPSAEELMEHKYLERTGFMSNSDELWENKVSMSFEKKRRAQRIMDWFRKIGRSSRTKLFAVRQFMCKSFEKQLKSVLHSLLQSGNPVKEGLLQGLYVRCHRKQCASQKKVSGSLSPLLSRSAFLSKEHTVWTKLIRKFRK